MESTQLSPHFVIPAGTQVVLKKDYRVMGPAAESGGKRRFKKAGSVGVVTQAPLTNDYTYVLAFADGETVRARRDDLSVRRSGAPEDDLPAREVEAFRPWLIYRVRMGSHAFGLADSGSDEDERGIYLPPAEWHWSLQPLPEQIEFKRADGAVVDRNAKAVGPRVQADVCWWELEKFLRLGLKANPNILETLYVAEEHVLQCDPMGRKLRQMREAFLSKYLYQTYSGYVLSQFKKMKQAVESGKEHRPKHAAHLIRLLYSGIEALRGRGILVDVGPYRKELLEIKTQRVEFAKVHGRALELNAVFEKEYARTRLPDAPDVAAVDRFLIEARRARTLAGKT